MSYRTLEIWKLARDVAVVVHAMTIKELPKFEMFEEGSQIRRSAKSICANIVEGYAQLDLLGRKLNVFIQGVERDHRVGEGDHEYPASRVPHLLSR